MVSRKGTYYLSYGKRGFDRKQGVKKPYAYLYVIAG
jgi:hypothetical protein